MINWFKDPFVEGSEITSLTLSDGTHTLTKLFAKKYS